MFGFIAGIARRLKHLFSKFKQFFTKPQYENFCRAVMGMMVAAQREHDIKSINQLFIDRKNQSSLNRFITESKWNIQDIVKKGKTCILARQS